MMHSERFSMPMYRRFVPEKLRPWLYFGVIICFQLSGGLYLASLQELMGERCFMREDCLMTLYVNLMGLALGFPLLFRTKFRFTNKQLLCFSAIGVIVENLVTMYCDFLPIIWLAAFFGGYCKIQGTFECFSNIQLWITPERNFRVFFPVLHIFVLGSVCLSAILTATFTYYMGWQMMHWFIIAIMLICLIFFTLCLRSFHHIPDIQPFKGIDWIGWLLLAAFTGQVLYIFTYGNWADWLNSLIIKQLIVTATLTLGLYIWRTFALEKPIIERTMWTFPHVVPILILTTILEALLAAEKVLEEMFVELMNYDILTHNYHFNGIGIIGILSGCLVAYLWLVWLQKRLLPLMGLGVMGIIGYLVLFYFRISPTVNIEQLYLAVAFRQFAAAILGACLLTALQSLVGFMYYFQCLAIFQLLHLCVGGAMGAALYSEALQRYVLIYAGNPFGALKTLYGWAIYAAFGALTAVWLYDTVLRHARLQRNLWIPSWTVVRKAMGKGMNSLSTTEKSKEATTI